MGVAGGKCRVRFQRPLDPEVQLRVTGGWWLPPLWSWSCASSCAMSGSCTKSSTRTHISSPYHQTPAACPREGVVRTWGLGSRLPMLCTGSPSPLVAYTVNPCSHRAFCCLALPRGVFSSALAQVRKTLYWSSLHFISESCLCLPFSQGIVGWLTETPPTPPPLAFRIF